MFIDKLKTKWRQLLIAAAILIIGCVSLILGLTCFRVTPSKVLSFTSPQGVAENLEGIGQTYDGNGYFLTTFYDVGEERKYAVKKIGEDGEVVFETELAHATKDDVADKGVFSTFIGVSEDKVIGFTGNWYYLYELKEDGLTLLDAWMGETNIGSGLGVRNFAFDAYEDTIDIYTLDNRGNGSSAQVLIEKTTIVGDSFVSSKANKIKRASGRKRLAEMGTHAKGLAITEDHQNVIVAFDSGVVMTFSTDLSVLDRGQGDTLSEADVTAYKENVREMKVVEDGGELTAAQYDGKDMLYVFLRDKTVRRLSLADFDRYGQDGFALETIATLGEYGNYASFDANSGTVFAVNEDGNTLYAVDTVNGGVIYSVGLNFKIKNMVAAYGTNQFVCQWQDTVTDTVKFTSYAYDTLDRMNNAGALSTVSIVLSIPLMAVAILLFVAAFNETFSVKMFEGLKWFFSNVWQSKIVYILILPSFALLFMFSLYPSISAVINSFFEYELGKPKVFVGFENYRELFVTNSGLFLEIVRNTILLVATYMFTQVVPPVLYAYLIMLLRNKNSVGVIRGFLYIPGLLPTIATMLMWRYGIYGINPDGALNVIIRAAGGEPIPFLGDSKYAIWSILAIGFPWVGGFLLFYGALMTVPTEVYDACELEGCGLVRRFFVIDLPFIMGQVKYVSIGAVIAGVKSVGRIMATTEGQMGTMTLMYKLYDYLNNNQYGMASTIAVIMVVLLAGISFARVRKMLKKENAYD